MANPEEQQRSPAMLPQPGSAPHAKQSNSTGLKQQLLLTKSNFCTAFLLVSILQVLGGTNLLDNNSSPHSPHLLFTVTFGNLFSRFTHLLLFCGEKVPVFSSCHAPNFRGVPQTAASSRPVCLVNTPHYHAITSISFP